MAKINNYKYNDPNAGNLERSHDGDSFQVSDLGFCSNGGRAIKIYDGTVEQIYSCFLPGSLVVTPISPPQIKYDCINGACIPSTFFKTPALYSTLSECEVACGTGCSGKCVSNSDWAQIEADSSALKSKNCS